jgi:2-polyprenyl-3-methyl-5-hydroxy-6-metoxy-1,4-benzoquinol methylase
MQHEYFRVLTDSSATSVEARIRLAITDMAAQLGITDSASLDAAFERELSRRVAKNTLSSLERSGIRISGARVLDDGAGLGMLSVEAAEHGALVTAIEPGRECCEIVKDRLGDAATVLEASGEDLPFEDESFDLVLSVQVLEHVKHPRRYVEEAWRVLKPGGHLYLACENYLAFVEPHYRVAWLPLLPKRLGAMYLKLRGRPTDFIRQSVTYTTAPWVSWMLLACGFESLRERELVSRFGSRGAARAVIAMQGALKAFRPGFYFIGAK